MLPQRSRSGLQMIRRISQRSISQFGDYHSNSTFRKFTTVAATQDPYFLPGPEKSDENLGNMGDMGAAGSLHQYLQQLHETYGSVVKFHWFTMPVVSVANPLLFKSLAPLFDRAGDLFLAFQPLIGKESVQYENGHEGFKRHNLMLKSWNRNAIASYEDLLMSAMKNEIDKQPKNETFLLQEFCLNLAIRGILSSSFGITSDEENEKIAHYYNVCWDEMELQLMGNLPDEKRKQLFDENLMALHEFAIRTKKQADDSIPNLKCPREHMFISKMRDAERLNSEQDRILMTPERIQADVITSLVGGIHTTGFVLTWLLYFLGKHKDVQQKLRQEIITAGPPSSTKDLFKNYPFLQQCINETLRVRCVAPWAARISDKEVELKDNSSEPIEHYIIPPNTPVIMALGVVQQDARIYPDPFEFKPERFETKTTKERKQKFSQFSFTPFGFAGNRICPGWNLSLVESSFVLTEILPNYEINLTNLEQNPGVDYGLVTKPRENVYVQLNSI